MTRKRVFAALSLMLFAIAAVACSGGDDAGGADGATAAREVASEQEAPSEGGGGSGGGGTAAGSTGYALDSGDGGDAYDVDMPRHRKTGLPDLGPSVIKTATVDLEVKDDELQEAIRNATSTAEKYGGFVVSTNVADDEEHPSGSIVVRVPATRFGDALGDLEGLGNVRSENVSGQDVSQEFVDLEARLRNYVTQETVMLRLMERAQTVLDTIRVQNELQRVQLEIERLRGRLGYLEDQTAMSTIELRITEEGATASPPGEFEKAWGRAKDGLVAVVAGIISSLGVVVPLALLTLLLIFVIARLRPRFTNAS